MDRIVIPEKLQRKIIQVGHKLGHLGSTKTKQLLCNKYWFPQMSTLIDETCDKCYECKVATKEGKAEPIKPTSIPQTAWHTVEMDFGGPFPDGHYNMVIIDTRTRYPVVENVASTSFKSIQEPMKHIFATYGVPQKIISDNGPPFNSTEFADFATQEGFRHHRVTPLHPRANGTVEAFMKMLNKTERISNLQGKSATEKRMAIQDMLIAYRSTPHPATGVAPYEAMLYRSIRTKLDYVEPRRKPDSIDNAINVNDKKYKKTMKERRENRNTRESKLILGDYVLVKQMKKNKLTTPYEPIFYIVTDINGSQITARRATDDRIVCRDASHFKLCNSVINTADETAADQAPEPLMREPTHPHNTQRMDDGPVKEADDQPAADVTIPEPPEMTVTGEKVPTTPVTTNRPRRTRHRPERFRDHIVDIKGHELPALCD